jgi:hypothetical protein
VTGPVSVDELQRAWDALQAGGFRSGTPRRRQPSEAWVPSEKVVVVVGALSRTGATTIALAIGDTATEATRLIECTTAERAGLADATRAELGVFDGWRRGARGNLVIERPVRSGPSPRQVPVPCGTGADLTIIDLGWIAKQDEPSWAENILVTAPQVIVSEATVLGVRALDRWLEQAARPNDTWCAVIGPGFRRWPRALRHETSARISQAYEAGRLQTVPEDARLRVIGPTVAALPRRVTSACASILGQIIHRPEGTSHHAQ